MTLQIPGTDKEKDELITDMYEALKNVELVPTVLKSHNYELILKAIAKAEGVEND